MRRSAPDNRVHGRGRGTAINSRGNAFDHENFRRHSQRSARTNNNVPLLLTTPVFGPGAGSARRSPPLANGTGRGNANGRGNVNGRPRSSLLREGGFDARRTNASSYGQRTTSIDSGLVTYHGSGFRETRENLRHPSLYSNSSHGQNRMLGSNGIVPLLKDERWREWPQVKVMLRDVPMSVDTFDLHVEFERFGELDMIEIKENDRGIKTGIAFVTLLNPITNAFWEEPFDWLTDKMRAVPHHTLKKLEQTRSFKMPSPINQRIIYPEIFKLNAKSLDFGFLYQPEIMVAMRTTKPEEEVIFQVNLRKRLLDITFKIWLNKAEHGTEDDEEEGEENSVPVHLEDRFELYRIQVPFAQLDCLYQGPSPARNRKNFILKLPSSPLFWRKLHDVKKSHEIGQTYWTSFDAWMRQTAIVYNPRDKRLRQSPISTKPRDLVVDMGRWKCYCFDFELDSETEVVFNQMLQALRDFNVDSKELRDFQVAPNEGQLNSIWDFLENSKKKSHSDSDYDLLAELLENKPILPYSVRYQLEVCVSRDYLSEYNMTEDFIRRLATLEEKEAVAILEHVADRKVRIFDPMKIFETRDARKATIIMELPEYNIIMRRAIVTPSSVYFSTPSVEVSNRVLRRWKEVADRFLRVQFKDEDGKIHQSDKRSMNEVFTRVKTTYDNGIDIGGRHFEFLACGNSQMREHGAYFFAPTDHVKAADIRAWMGDFSHIRIVAKHAARLGQCFSTSRAIKSTNVDFREIPDVVRNEYTFTDGVGKISSFLATLISNELASPQEMKALKPSAPYYSCFQFRLGGCKGVLTVWPDVEGREVQIRPSQHKFEAVHHQLEVIRCSKFASANLNRQLIIVLSCLGIDDHVFVSMLREMLRKYEEAVKVPDKALALLRRNIDPNQSTLEIAMMVRNGFMTSKEPFVISLLHLWRAWTIKYLKEKARILIDNGAFLLGCTDETGILKGYSTDGSDMDIETCLPEIFCQVSDHSERGSYRVITGKCIIARNPSLHPGDVRTVMAVDVPQLHHIVDCVVFSQKGERDLPSMLSGGDLDGDDYIVIWDEELTASVQNYKPMNYFAQPPPELDRPVEVSDMTAFYVQYMKNDTLGMIANNHLAWADKRDEGVKSDKCLDLAQLHSAAVDYPKTGEPARMPKSLRCHPYPHFFEKDEQRSYISHKILGQLYDMVERIDFVPDYNLGFNETIIAAADNDPAVLKAAREIKAEYDASLRRIMAQFAIKTEHEVFSTFVIAHDMGSKDYKFHEEMGSISLSIKDRNQKAVMKHVGTTSLRDPKLESFVATMYAVTAQDVTTAKAVILEARKKKRHVLKSNGQSIDSAPKIGKDDVDKLPLLSFPWIFPEVLSQIAQRGRHAAGDLGAVPEIENQDVEQIHIHEIENNNVENNPEAVPEVENQDVEQIHIHEIENTNVENNPEAVLLEEEDDVSASQDKSVEFGTYENSIIQNTMSVEEVMRDGSVAEAVDDIEVIEPGTPDGLGEIQE